MEAAYANRSLKLREDVYITDGMYYYQGQVRTTRRIVGKSGSYLDLHPAEELLLELFDGTHTLGDVEQRVASFQNLDLKMPIRHGLDLIVQLDNIEALS